jgi:hypothetical protein
VGLKSAHKLFNQIRKTPNAGSSPVSSMPTDTADYTPATRK